MANTTITDEQFNHILSRMEQGKSVSSVSKEMGVPLQYFTNYLNGCDLITDNRTIRANYKKRVTEEEKEYIVFSRILDYERAKELREECFFSIIEKIANDDSKDCLEGNAGFNSVKRAVLKIEALKWILSRMSSSKAYESKIIQRKETDDNKVNIILNINKDDY